MNKKVKSEKITIEELALITKNGFDGVDKRFEKVEQRFDGVNKRFEKVEQKVDRVIEKVNTLDQKVDNFKEEVIDEVAKAKDTILKSNDEIAILLKDSREEQAMLVGADKRHQEKLEDHEERIKNLEFKGIAYKL
jgi:uncharacterized protein YoxC